MFSDGHGANGGDAQISIQDLLDPLHGKPGYSSLRKRLQHIEKKPMTVQAPLPRVERERLERKVAYDHTKKDMTKWEPLVKRNREAPTIYFEEDVDIGYSTVGAIASEFRPRTDFEKKMAQLVQDPEIVDAHQKDGDKLLTLNKVIGCRRKLIELWVQFIFCSFIVISVDIMMRSICIFRML